MVITFTIKFKVQNVQIFLKENRAVYVTITKNDPGLAGAKKNRFATVATEARQNVSCSWQRHVAHLRQQCHNSKFVIIQEKLLKALKCYNFL